MILKNKPRLFLPATSNVKRDLEQGPKESNNTKNEITINNETLKVLSKREIKRNRVRELKELK
ncbi:MAG: hypothetical protein WBM98_10835 [Maribacter sp.]|uniref:hypothetical protein n=1 Tax=Maribacter sp. TaxID=1897614 RepID=UPI003C710A38